MYFGVMFLILDYYRKRPYNPYMYGHYITTLEGVGLVLAKNNAMIPRKTQLKVKFVVKDRNMTLGMVASINDFRI